MFDYVIVGGGSAGCVLANRLSVNPDVTVCLLEAGPADKSFMIHMPMGILGTMRSKRLNWQFNTEPQDHLNQRSLYWPRGKTLGGSSSINAMVYHRGHPSDYDQWAVLGNAGWRYDDVLPYFKKSQHQERGESYYHGVNGPLNVCDHRQPNPLHNSLIAAGQAVGYRENDDFNGATPDGVGWFQVTQKDGQRCSAAKAFLSDEVKARPNLTILTDAHASKVVFEGKKAIAVEYLHRRKTSKLVKAKREVLLCGGAINSPQLLLLSGVGCPDALAEHNIPVTHALPGVGKNLQDHLDMTVVDKEATRHSLAVALSAVPTVIKAIFLWIFSRKGVFTSNAAQAGGFVHTDVADPQGPPDIQYHFIAAALQDHGRKFSYGYGYTVHVCQLHPKSRGYVGLRSADPLADPVMQPNYLADPDDKRVMRAAYRSALSILDHEIMQKHHKAPWLPATRMKTDQEIDDDIAQRAESVYHPVGSCKMGPSSDSQAVVNERLCVHGVDALRVVDASIMPTVVGGNTNAPTIMIAEKAADMIIQDNVCN